MIRTLTYHTTPYPFADFGTEAANIVGQYNPPGWDVNVSQTGPAASAIVSLQFGSGGVWFNTYTAAARPQSGADTSGPYPIPHGLFDNAGGTTTFGIRAWHMIWIRVDFEQGSTNAILTTSNCVGSTCDYTLACGSRRLARARLTALPGPGY